MAAYRIGTAVEKNTAMPISASAQGHVRFRATAQGQVITLPDESIVIDTWEDGFTSLWHFKRGHAVDWDGSFDD